MLETFLALAEPNRLRIVELLLSRPYAVGELSEELKARQPQVSKHLKVLRDAGLVELRVDAQRRIYSLRPQPLKELDAWLHKYRQNWEARFDKLDVLLEEIKTKEKKEKKP